MFDLNALIAQRLKAFEALKDLPPSTYGDVTELWSNYFSNRARFPDAENFPTFRNARASGVQGMGDHTEADYRARLFFDAVCEASAHTGFPDQWLLDHPEPALGDPVQFDYAGQKVSANYLKQLVAVWHLHEVLVDLLGVDQPLRICEIGAGFGLNALLLHKFLNIGSYTIIDLPENLYLSSIYLPAQLTELSHQVVDGQSPLTQETEQALNFVLAPLADQVHGPFDLIINTASLAEMPLETSNAYLSWINQALAPDGLFYSVNRLNVRGREDALKHSDFDFLEFGIRKMTWIPGPLRPTNQNGMMLVLGKMTSRETPADQRQFDALAQLIAAGGTDEVAPLADKFVQGALSSDDQHFLEHVWAFFVETDLPKKYKLLDTEAFRTRPKLQAALAVMVLSSAGSFQDVLAWKPTLLALNLDPKLAASVLGHVAEVEFIAGFEAWTDTIAQLAGIAPSQARMLEHEFEQQGPGLRMVGKFWPLICPLQARDLPPAFQG